MVDKTEKELKLIKEIEKIRIEKIKVSSKYRLQELILKRDIAMIYRNKGKKKKAEKEIIKLNPNKEVENENSKS